MRIKAESKSRAGVGNQRINLVDERSRVVGQIDLSVFHQDLTDPALQSHLCSIIAEAINASALSRMMVQRPRNVVL